MVNTLTTKWKCVSIQRSTDFRKCIALWKVGGLQSFVLLLRPACRWWDGTDRGETALLGQKRVTLPTTNSVWTDLGLNRDLRREKLATNCRIHETARETEREQEKYQPGIYIERESEIQSVPHSKHSPSVTKTSQLRLYREIIAVCSQIHTKHINTLCGQNVELMNVKLAVHIVTTGL